MRRTLEFRDVNECINLIHLYFECCAKRQRSHSGINTMVNHASNILDDETDELTNEPTEAGADAGPSSGSVNALAGAVETPATRLAGHNPAKGFGIMGKADRVALVETRAPNSQRQTSGRQDMPLRVGPAGGDIWEDPGQFL